MCTSAHVSYLRDLDGFSSSLDDELDFLSDVEAAAFEFERDLQWKSCAIIDELLVQPCCADDTDGTLKSYLLPLRSMMGGVRGPRSRCGEDDDGFRSRLRSGRERSLLAGEVLGNESISIFSCTFHLRCDSIELELSVFCRVCLSSEKRERKAVDSIDVH